MDKFLGRLNKGKKENINIIIEKICIKLKIKLRLDRLKEYY